MSYEECQELKNIKYKTMLLNGKTNILNSLSNDVSNMDLLLDNECNENKKEGWNKLDKSIKMLKIQKYIEDLSIKYKLSKAEKLSLKEYLSNNIDKKFLCKNKDVVYMKELGVLENIPNLYFNNSTRKFSLKKTTTHVSTSKALGPTKKNKSRSNKKNLSVKLELE